MLLKEFMKKYRVTKKEMATKIGISRYCLYLYLKGKRRPRLSTAIKIQELTKGMITVKDLRGRDEREDFF